MKKTELELILAKLKGFVSPRLGLEQYGTPSGVSASILHHIKMQGDIVGKTVADLGCGTGILSIGCSLLGAETVYGVDIDQAAIDISKENESMINGLGYLTNIEWLAMGVEDFSQKVDTVVQNPPFGIKSKGADRAFIKKALEVADVVYSIHHFNEGTRKFIKEFAKSVGSCANIIATIEFQIPWTYLHHKKRYHTTFVDLYKMEAENEA